ncbi:MAG: hypothetical protein ABIK62_08010 [candidate division WOR-3 bacterium]
MRQELRLEQRLMLTPQLMMNLKLLQMPVLELEQRIQQELETNPALEETQDLPDPETPTELEELPAATEDQAEPTTADTEDLLGLREQETPEIRNLEGALDQGEMEIADFLQDDGYLPPLEPRLTPARETELTEPPGTETLRLSDILLPQLRARARASEEIVRMHGEVMAVYNLLAEKLGAEEDEQPPSPTAPTTVKNPFGGA